METNQELLTQARNELSAQEQTVQNLLSIITKLSDSGLEPLGPLKEMVGAMEANIRAIHAYIAFISEQTES